MDRLRKLSLVGAIILLGIVVLIEIGARLYIGTAATADLPAPGIGVPYLALVDGIVLFSLLISGLTLIVPDRLLGAAHGIATLLFTLLMLIGSIVLIFAALMLLTMMVTLLLAVPFGTAAYFAAFADFEIGAARTTLGVLMLLKVTVAALLFRELLAVKGLMLLVATSLVANIVVAFLHGLVPLFLVSILDAVAAIIVGVLAAVWALIKLIGSIPAILTGLRLDRHAS